MLVTRSQLTHRDREVRVEAVQGLVTLAGYGDDEARELLREIVTDYRDFDVEIYSRALNRVEVFGDQRLAEPLLAALGDTDHGCQLHTAEACGRLGVRAAEPLLVALVEHPQVLVRESACYALGDLEATTAVCALARSLDDESEYVRAAAGEVLADLGGADAIEALWSAFRARRYRRPHYLAQALARCGPDIHDRLVEATAHDDPEIRFWAATALGATGEERFEPVLARLAADDHATTPTGAHVSTGAKKALRSSRRRRERRDSGQPAL
ncbi:HEAT repeat domain-containing protein [Cellulomonas cellasea]|uniref:HEAT repeat protein n=1 Tax=Cellulomonas cellasea TaxID=43670 RepID=A0A7W4UFH9_9CELL|nr:HEAT repeat domain-containing protein [Cellulomonas cellasea]MBB2923232.1 HEAT repeat protein [Cellulomonas cellasea]